MDGPVDVETPGRFSGGRQGDISGVAKTTGAARYVGDLKFDGLLEAGVIRSTVPHADILSVDLGAALKVPGIVAAVTGEDFGDVTYIGFGGNLSDRPPLARGTVRYVGEEIAALAATSREALAKALPLVKVRYRRKPAVLTVQQAMAPDAPRLHSINEQGNVIRTSRLERGSMDCGQATHRFSARYQTGSQAHACLETHTVVAWWPREEGTLDLWTPTQGPVAIRRELAHLFAIEEQRIAMHEVAIGGDFGSRVKISTSEAIAVALARKSRRPVRLCLSREEEFSVTKHRFPFDVDIELQADRQGVLTHMKADAVSDMGAYHYVGAGDFGFFPQSLSSIYAIDNLRISTVGVYTNHNPPGSFRGAGAPQSSFVRECALDELALSIGLDPIDIRRRNLVKPQDPTTGWNLDHDRLRACLDRAVSEIGWREKYEVDGKRRGFGVALAAHVTGVGPLKAAALIDLDEAGGITVRSSSADPGTGQRTIIAQVAAHELGVAVDRIRVVLGEPQTSPYDPGLGASKGSYVSSNAVGTAARELAGRLRAAAIARFGVNEVSLERGFAVTARGSASFGELVASMPDAKGGVVSVEGSFAGGRAMDDPDQSDGYSYAAHAVEVEVDEALGLVRIIKVAAVHDSGTILNPIMAQGQIEGGVMMGLGAALGEEFVNEGGRMANAGFADYVVPRASSLPEMKVVFLDSNHGPGLYGSRGVAEACLAPTTAAVANAIANATGIRIRSLPITPDKIVSARPQALLAGIRPIWMRPSRWWVELVRRLYPLGLHAALDRWAVRRAGEREEAPGTISLHRATDASDAMEALARPGHMPLGGGTDLMLRRRQGLLNGPATWVDIRGAEAMRSIELKAGSLRLGAAVTLSELAASEAILENTALRDTVREIATEQVRNVATLAGNLCQAKRCWFYRHDFNCYKRSGPTSPCYAIEGDHRFYHAAMDGHRCQATTPSDLATTLMALDAELQIHSAQRERRLGVADLYVGPGETALGGDEMIAFVTIPDKGLRRSTAFAKLSLYKGGFAVCSCAVSIDLDQNGIATDIRVILGGVAPTPRRLSSVENMLLGQVPSTKRIEEASASWVAGAHPLRDNGWKLSAAAALVARVTADAVKRAGR